MHKVTQTNLVVEQTEEVAQKTHQHPDQMVEVVQTSLKGISVGLFILFSLL